jgi:hypothetical protein
MWLLVLQLHVWIYVFTYAHSMCCWTHLYALWMCLFVCRTWATLCMWVIVGIYVRVCSIVFQRVVAFCPCYLLPTFDRFLKIHDFPTRFRLCCVPRPLLWQTISVITFFSRSGRAWFRTGWVHMLETKHSSLERTILVLFMECFGMMVVDFWQSLFGHRWGNHIPENPRRCKMRVPWLCRFGSQNSCGNWPPRTFTVFVISNRRGRVRH